MNEQIGTLALLGLLATLTAEQLFGGWLHKTLMQIATLVTAIVITYAAWFVADVPGLGLDFSPVRVLPLSAAWAYGVIVFVVSHYERRALKAAVPGMANPSVKVGDVVGKPLEAMVKALRPPAEPEAGMPSLADIDALITEGKAKGWTIDQIREEGKKRGIKVA